MRVRLGFRRRYCWIFFSEEKWWWWWCCNRCRYFRSGVWCAGSRFRLCRRRPIHTTSERLAVQRRPKATSSKAAGPAPGAARGARCENRGIGQQERSPCCREHARVPMAAIAVARGARARVKSRGAGGWGPCVSLLAVSAAAVT